MGEDVRDSPLYSACLHGHVQVVRYLNEVAKVDITRANAVTGTTPLYFACSFGKLRVVQYLVGTGKIDVHAARCRGRTLLHALCESPGASMRKRGPKTFDRGSTCAIIRGTS